MSIAVEVERIGGANVGLVEAVPPAARRELYLEPPPTAPPPRRPI